VVGHVKALLCLESRGWFAGCRGDLRGLLPAQRALRWGGPLTGCPTRGEGAGPPRGAGGRVRCGGGREGLLWSQARFACETPRTVLAIAANSICRIKITLCVLPPADTVVIEGGRN